MRNPKPKEWLASELSQLYIADYKAYTLRATSIEQVASDFLRTKKRTAFYSPAEASAVPLSVHQLF
jgi:hypothetical protein